MDGSRAKPGVAAVLLAQMRTSISTQMCLAEPGPRACLLFCGFSSDDGSSLLIDARCGLQNDGSNGRVLQGACVSRVYTWMQTMNG